MVLPEKKRVWAGGEYNCDCDVGKYCIPYVLQNVGNLSAKSLITRQFKRMKKSTLILFLFLFLQNVEVFGVQTPIVLDLRGKLGTETFALGKVVPASAGGQYFSLTRLQYYVSNIVIVHDGNVNTPLVETHLLVNPATQSKYALGWIDCQNIEGIKFTVGVDAIHNHQDPANYPPGHPLAFQDPSMHWGWSAGYRFVVIEGYGGTSPTNVNALFQIHSVGDELTRNVDLTVNGVAANGSIEIPIDADYTNVIAGINVSFGLINHSNENEAVEMMDNMNTIVFTPGTPTDMRELENSKNRNQIVVFPQPVSSHESMSIQFSNAAHRNVVVRDVLGREVYSVSTEEMQLSIPSLHTTSGVYIISAECNGVVTNNKVVVE